MLTSFPQRFLKNPPLFDLKDANKINKLPLKEYFEDLMLRRPANDSGYINLPTSNFQSMVERIQSEEDVKTVLYAQVNYIGHRNLLQHSLIDRFMLKALEVGHPDLMLDNFLYHKELLYHPHPRVTQKYFEHYAV